LGIFVFMKTTLKDLHALAAWGIKLYALTKDPMTASAVEILFKTSSLPMTEPQKNAANLLTKQRDAYLVLFPDPLV